MITCYRSRDLNAPGGDEDRVAWEFERVRFLMIEATAREFGLEPVRVAEGPEGAGEATEDLEVSVEIDFANDAVSEVADLERRLHDFLTSLEDRDVAHMLFEVDRTDERAFLEGISLAFLTVYDRDESPEAA